MHGPKRPVAGVDLELEDVIESQAVAPQQMPVSAGLDMPANRDERTLAVRNRNAVLLECGGNVREPSADANPCQRLVADRFDFHTLVEIHAEQDGVIAAGGEAAILMAAATGDEVLVVGLGEADRGGDV